MLILYTRYPNFSQEIIPEIPVLTPAQYAELEQNVIRILSAPKFQEAGNFLTRTRFDLLSCTNSLGDQNCFLSAQISLHDYLAIERSRDIYRSMSKSIAEAFSKCGHSIRFVAIEINYDCDVGKISTPQL